MPFDDALVANPGRLRILTALASEPQQDFVRLRNVTRLTDGNLATHGAGSIAPAWSRSTNPSATASRSRASG